MEATTAPRRRRSSPSSEEVDDRSRKRGHGDQLLRLNGELPVGAQARASHRARFFSPSPVSLFRIFRTPELRALSPGLPALAGRQPRRRSLKLPICPGDCCANSHLIAHSHYNHAWGARGGARALHARRTRLVGAVARVERDRRLLLLVCGALGVARRNREDGGHGIMVADRQKRAEVMRCEAVRVELPADPVWRSPRKCTGGGRVGLGVSHKRRRRRAWARR